MSASTLLPTPAAPPPGEQPRGGARGGVRGEGGKQGWAWLVLLLLVVAGGVGYWAMRRTVKPLPAASVRTAVVERGRFERTLRLSGMTAAGNLAYLKAPVLERAAVEEFLIERLSVDLEIAHWGGHAGAAGRCGG
ncbi:MAG: hypothetical protein IPJ98_29635 [Bryobacterales bacterium]|nr:hypothetical protein [Bryobacterales bacterium]